MSFPDGMPGIRAGLFLCLATLAACQESPPAVAPEISTDARVRPEARPIMGQERRITVLTSGLLDGVGLVAEDRYPARLEAVLRARGLNARVVAVYGEDETGGFVAALVTAMADPARRPELVILPAGLPVDPALRASLARHETAVIHADLQTTAEQRPELFHPDGHGLSALGIEELAVMTRASVIAALGNSPPPPPN